jgi:hypothetical protein
MVYHDKNPALGRSEDHRIGLYTTYFDYVHKAERLPTAGEDLIRYVNKKRNSLLLTHGVDGVSQSEVRDAYLGARKIMKDQAKWVKSFDKFKFSVEIDPLFYMSDLLGVTKYLEKI